AYQWYFNDEPIEGAQNFSYIPLVDGDYSVEVFDGNGCSNVSTAMDITIIAVEENDLTHSVRVFPNPTSNRLTVVLEGRKPTLIRLIDVVGNVVYHQEKGIRELNIIETNALANGIYHLMITSDDDVDFVKV